MTVVLEWINSHFDDFEFDRNLADFIEKFQLKLKDRVILIISSLNKSVSSISDS